MDTPCFGPFDPTAEYRLRPGGYVVLVDSNDRVAVLRGKSGMFLPGGGQDEGESPENAAVREAMEEAGFRVELRGCLCVADERVFAGAPWGHFRKRCSFFAADLVAGTPIEATSGSEGVLDWVDLLSALDRLSHASQRWALLHWLDSRGDRGVDVGPHAVGAMLRETWSQVGASIDALDAMIEACPDELWSAGESEPWFWATAFHVVFFLDYNLAEEVREFHPPAPFTLSELDPAGVYPDRVYSRAEIRAYLAYARERARMKLLRPRTDWLHRVHEQCSITGTGFEVVLYMMRHVQHHTGQLASLLRRAGIEAPRWKKRAAGADR